MLYSVCSECQHHNRMGLVTWASIPSDWLQRYRCAVCDVAVVAHIGNSYLVSMVNDPGGH